MNRKQKNFGCVLMCVCLALVGGVGCQRETGKKRTLDLTGTWTLSQSVSPIGYVRHYPNDGMTYCRIYDEDTTFYECQLAASASGMVIIPAEHVRFTLIDKGHGEVLYFENEHPRPLTVVDDTTIVIQQYGVKYTWVLAQDMTQSRIDEIRNIIANAATDVDEEVKRYVLSTTERQLKATNHTLLYVVSLLGVTIALIAFFAIRIQRRNRRIERQLQQIKDEQELRPLPVKNAMREVEEEFLQSDYYLGLRKRIAGGGRLKQSDWEEMERRIQSVYPYFTKHLLSLCKISPMELQVCLLIKLNVPFVEIANVLSRDISSISCIRIRLYQKVFQRKGSAKDWDDFLRSL